MFGKVMLRTALVAIALAGCGSSSNNSSGAPQSHGGIGDPCSVSTDCPNVKYGICFSAGVCGRTCLTNVDCGAKDETPAASISAGASCTAARCYKVCTDGAQCAGTTTCKASGSTLYNVCMP
jgi:hypothetical protein